MLEINKIYNMDCLEGMKSIPDKSIDMILCDLPYGTTKNKWDSILPLDLLWEQYNRIIKDNGAIVLTAQTPFDKVLGASNLKMLRYEWIWKKTRATGHLNSKKAPLKNHENVLVFYKKLPTYNPQLITGKAYRTRSGTPSSNYGKQRDYETINDGFRYPVSVQEFKHDKESLHPTRKPVALFEYLIKTYTNEGELVLDNCMGSGTTAVACINTNRKYIGFELDNEYFDKSIERIKALKERDGDLMDTNGCYYVPEWAIKAFEDGVIKFKDAGKMYIETLEGDMHAQVNDWIIKGVKGELYPCKPDVFEMTYELVEEMDGR